MTRKGWTLLLVCVATFMLLLDVSVVTTALPSIREDLDASFSDVQWTLDAYTLPLAVLLLPAASLADITGRRRIFVVGMAVFTLASAACALAWNPTALNVSRAFPGAGGALLFATALPLLGNEFRGRDRAGALGIWGAVLSGSVAVGPLVGGALTDGLGWRWIFLVNVPVGIFALVLGMARLAESREPSGRRVDYLGVLLLGLSLTGIVYGTVQGNSAGWLSADVVTAFAVGVVLLVGFVVSQARQSQPMLDLSLFRSATFTGAMLVSFLLSAAMLGIFAYIVIFLQSGVGYSALDSGVRFLPLSVLSFAAAAFTGRVLLGRVPIRWLLTASLVISAVGVALISRVDGSETWLSMVPGYLVTGFGLGMSTPLLAEVALAAVVPQRAGMATGAVSTGRQVGVAVGVAGLGALFEARVRDGMIERLTGVLPAGTPVGDIGSAVAAGGGRTVLESLPESARSAVAAAARAALADGLSDITLVSALTLAVAAVLAVVLVRKDAVHEPPPAASTGPVPHA